MLVFETDSHSGVQGEIAEVSDQAGLFITVEKACIEGHLVSLCGKGIVFVFVFSCCFG